MSNRPNHFIFFCKALTRTHTGTLLHCSSVQVVFEGLIGLSSLSLDKDVVVLSAFRSYLSPWASINENWSWIWRFPVRWFSSVISPKSRPSSIGGVGQLVDTLLVCIEFTFHCLQSKPSFPSSPSDLSGKPFNFCRRGLMEAGKTTSQLPTLGSAELLAELEQSLSLEKVDLSNTLSKAIAKGIASRPSSGGVTKLPSQPQKPLPSKPSLPRIPSGTATKWVLHLGEVLFYFNILHLYY